jgi:DNA-binding PadR family transcriptional regulator
MPRDEQPLAAHWFHILLALADEDRHGLEITKDVFGRTNGTMHLWPGKLYGALKKMTKAGLVADAKPPRDFQAAGGRPRFSRLTDQGRRALAIEAERLAGFVEAARSKRLIKRPRAS